MTEPIPQNPNLEPERPWFEVQAKLLENAVDTHSDTSGLSNHLLWLINDRANSSPWAQDGSLSEIDRIILFEEDIKNLHESLPEGARKAFAKDAVDLTTPGKELPEHAEWLIPDPEAEGTSTRDLLIEALVSKFREFEQIVDPYDRGIGVESITGVHSITNSELQALLDPNRATGFKEPVYPIVTEASSATEEVSEDTDETTNTFERELAECQDAIQLRTLLEDRAQEVQESIRRRAYDAQEAIKLLDNNDSLVLETAERFIVARELSAARKLIKHHASSPEKYQQIMLAIQDKEVDTILSQLSSNDFYYSDLLETINNLEIPEANRAELRSLIDPRLIGSIERRVNSDDPLDQEDVLTFLPYFSEPAIARKVKEIFEFQATDIIPEMPEVPNEGIREPTLKELADSMYRSKDEIEGRDPYSLTDRELEEALRKRRDTAKKALLNRANIIEAKLGDENPEATLILQLAKAAAKSNTIVVDGKFIGFPIQQADRIIRESVFDYATKQKMRMVLSPLVLDWAERIVDHRWPEQFDMTVSDKKTKEWLDKKIQEMTKDPVLYAKRAIYLQSSKRGDSTSAVMIDALSYTVYKEANKILEDGPSIWKHPLQRALGYVHGIDTTNVKRKIPFYDRTAQRMSLALRQPQVGSVSGDYNDEQMK